MNWFKTNKTLRKEVQALTTKLHNVQYELLAAQRNLGAALLREARKPSTLVKAPQRSIKAAPAPRSYLPTRSCYVAPPPAPAPSSSLTDLALGAAIGYALSAGLTADTSSSSSSSSCSNDTFSSGGGGDFSGGGASGSFD